NLFLTKWSQRPGRAVVCIDRRQHRQRRGNPCGCAQGKSTGDCDRAADLWERDDAAGAATGRRKRSHYTGTVLHAAWPTLSGRRRFAPYSGIDESAARRGGAGPPSHDDAARIVAIMSNSWVTFAESAIRAISLAREAG